MNVQELKQAIEMNKRGNVSHPLIMFILGLFSVGIIAGIYVLVLAEFQTSTTNAEAITVFNNTLTMFTNFTGQLDTVGTIGGVLLLVVLLGAAGIGIYYAYQRAR